MSLLLGLLGPAAAWHHGRALDLGSPQQRALFALLLLHRNELVSTDRIIDALWPARPPANALPVLRTYVSRLRAGPLAPVLQTRHHGYELRVGPDAVDADRFEALAAAGRAAGDALTAEALLTEALALVRGPPLPELADDHLAGRERERLEELRAAVEEELVEVRLAQGRHRELVPALRAAVAADPLRERSWGQLMVALYRSGRQAEALAAYQDARHTLAEELALEPGPQLRALERMVLTQDAALDAPPAHEPTLPHYATSFVGRDTDCAAVAAALRDERLVTVSGPAGVGKTRLAAEVVATRWWVGLGAVSPGRVMATVARTLAVPEVPGRAPIDLIVARLHDSPELLVLDNCEHVLGETADTAARILEGEPGARILTTSREPLRLGGEAVHTLAGLDASDGARLFRERSAADGPAVADIVARLDGLPLAIELAAAQLASMSLPELAASLRERLPGDGAARTAPSRHRTLDAAIAWSYELLTEAERHVLRRLAVFPSSFDATAAEAVSGGTLAALTRLVGASLLVPERGRYRLLQTVHAFADERLREAREHEDAARRHRDHYLRLAEDVGRNMVGSGLPVWLARGRLEHENFSAALHYSLDRREGEPALQMASALGWYWFRSSRVTEGRALLEQALALAAPDSAWRPRGLVGRAWITVASGEPDWLAVADEAVAACEGGWLLAEARAARAQALTATGPLDAARAEIGRARSAAAAAGHTEGMAFVDNMLGVLHLKEGDLDGAEALLRSAHEGMRRMRGTRYAGYTLMDLARVKLAQHQPEEVLEIAAQALEDFERREDPRGIAAANIYFGRAHLMLGEEERGRAELADARALCDLWGFPGLASEIPG